MTKEKFDQLEKDLQRLKNVIRPKLAAEVARLAELGDFSENAEYQLAKGKLRGTNNAILKLEAQVRDAEIIKPNQSGKVIIGSVVEVEVGGKQKTYQILGSSETKPDRGIISYSSPLGAVLMGSEVGEEVLLKVGDKQMRIVIKSVR